jgi:hypothetical protein
LIRVYTCTNWLTVYKPATNGGVGMDEVEESLKRIEGGARAEQLQSSRLDFKQNARRPKGTLGKDN